MKDFVPYELSLKLKEKGFKHKCYAHYQTGASDFEFNQNTFCGGHVKDCSFSYNSLPAYCFGSDFVDAPTISQVLDWMRKKLGIHIAIDHIFSETIMWDFEVVRIGSYERWCNDGATCDSYEEAALAGIKYVLDKLL